VLQRIVRVWVRAHIVHERLRRSHDRREELRRVRERVPARRDVRRERVRVPRGANGLRHRCFREVCRSEEGRRKLRRVRNVVRHGRHLCGWLLRLFGDHVRIVVRDSRDRSCPLRRLRNRVSCVRDVRGICVRVPGRCEGLRIFVHEHRRRPERVRNVRCGVRGRFVLRDGRVSLSTGLDEVHGRMQQPQHRLGQLRQLRQQVQHRAGVHRRQMQRWQHVVLERHDEVHDRQRLGVRRDQERSAQLRRVRHEVREGCRMRQRRLSDV